MSWQGNGVVVNEHPARNPVRVDFTNWKFKSSGGWLSSETNECVIPRSNNAWAVYPAKDIIPFTTTFDALLSCWVSANTLLCVAIVARRIVLLLVNVCWLCAWDCSIVWLEKLLLRSVFLFLYSFFDFFTLLSSVSSYVPLHHMQINFCPQHNFIYHSCYISGNKGLR